MPHWTINDASLYVRIDGGEDADRTVVFCHGLLFSGRMFDEQVASLVADYRCVRMDFRGQGDSEVTKSGYDLDTLADDVIALLGKLDASPVHLVGFSMGGMVAQRVALKRGDLLRSLVLMNTSAEAEPAGKRPRFALLNLVARWLGVKRVVPRIQDLLFSDVYLDDPARAEDRKRWAAMLEANDRVGATRAVKGVVRRRSILDRLGSIDLPTLIIAGENDRATPPSRARHMKAMIPGARLVEFPRCGHMTPAEVPDAVNLELRAFLESLD